MSAGRRLIAAPWYLRMVGYVAGLVVVAGLSALVSAVLATLSCPADGTDCDLGGLVVAGVVLMTCFGYALAVVLLEGMLIARRARSRAARSENDS